MAVVGKNVNDQLDRIKKNISNAYLYFKPNYDRFHEFRKFVYETSINDDQKAVLNDLKKPIIEFNILEAYISRLMGEFAKHEPSIEVTPADGVPVSPEVLEIVEGHIRHIIYEGNKDSLSSEVYKDLLSGGFSVIKIWTEFASSMSFNQVLRVKRVFDPTLCGFDPMARTSHKGDGNFSFELYPMTEDDFNIRYSNIDLTGISYTREIEGFNWSYRSDKEAKIMLVGEYFEKKKKKTKIVKLANGRVITAKNYEKLEQYWKDQQFIEQIPAVVGKSRMSEIETICRYELIESQVLSYEETDFSYLPHIFADGNSIVLRKGTSNTTYQMTRPYVYHAKGVQNLKNFAGQTLGNVLENMIQHKFIMKKEAIPQEEDYLDALNDIQHANTIVVNAYSENNPDKPIPDPIREVQHVPTPPEVMGTFQVTDPVTQTILGSFASNLGRNDADLSGKAVIETATISNAAAMPYVMGYLSAWTQLGIVAVDLIPKYLLGKRNIPVVGIDGKKKYRAINDNGAPTLDYDSNAILVNIEAGVNFQVQKNQALSQIIALMGVSEEFAGFMNSPMGLPILLKNLTIHGSDELQAALPQWEKQKEQNAEEQKKMQLEMMNNDPRMIEAKTKAMKAQVETQLEVKKLSQEEMDSEFEKQTTIAKLGIENKKADAEILKAERQAEQEQINSAVQLEKANAEIVSHSLDAAAKIADIEHRHNMDHHESVRESVKLHHEIERSRREQNEKSNNE